MGTRIMGILNLTPDSFFSGSRATNVQQAVARMARLISEGADMIDVGACSTRPGADRATLEEEMERLEISMPLLRREFPDIPLSIDTYRAEIAERCLKEWGFTMVNDISGGNEDIYRVSARFNAEYVLTYGEPIENDPVREMVDFFEKKLEILKECGVSRTILDPGFGFGKTLDQNYCIMKHLDALQSFHLPVLVGISRKSMITKTLGITSDEALNGTTVLNTFAALNNVDWLRVHDVQEAVQTVIITEKLKTGAI